MLAHSRIELITAKEISTNILFVMEKKRRKKEHTENLQSCSERQIRAMESPISIQAAQAPFKPARRNM